MFTDKSLQEEIEALKVNRRVLSKHSSQAHLAPKSRKLASVQRLMSDTHEFLVEYLDHGKVLTRNSAKQAYRNFHVTITDVRTSGLVVNLSEQEFDSAWGTLAKSDFYVPKCGSVPLLNQAECVGLIFSFLSANGCRYVNFSFPLLLHVPFHVITKNRY